MNKKTKKYISISETPGTFGLRFHNQGYSLLRIDAVYFPLKVSSKDLEPMMNLVRDNFYGCGVSMPHKINVIDFLDSLGGSAVLTQTVNTVLNDQGTLIGHNTDYYGARQAILRYLPKGIREREVLILGAGGAARAIGFAVKDLGGKVTLTNREIERARNLSSKLNSEVIQWDDRSSFSGYLLINATSVGMADRPEIPIDENSLQNYQAVMDAVVGKTQLMKRAEDFGKISIPGRTMTVYQAARQFELYTGKNLPQSFLYKFLEEK